MVDTHAWLWAVNDGGRRLGRTARRVLGSSAAAGVPAISQIEGADLFASGRIATDERTVDWLERALDEPPFAVVPLTPDIAATTAEL